MQRPIGGDAKVERLLETVQESVDAEDLAGWSPPVAIWNGGEWTWSWALDTDQSAESLPHAELTLLVRPYFYPSGAQEAELETVRIELVANFWPEERPEAGTVVNLRSHTFSNTELSGKVEIVTQMIKSWLLTASVESGQLAERFFSTELHNVNPVESFNEALAQIHESTTR